MTAVGWMGVACGKVERLTMVNLPQLVAAVLGPPAQVSDPTGGVPARYKVWFWIKPTVAPPGIAVGGPATLFTRSSDCTLAWVPPHSGPQLRIHACVLSLLKKPNTGRSNPGTLVQTLAGQVAFFCPATMLKGETIVTASEL